MKTPCLRPLAGLVIMVATAATGPVAPVRAQEAPTRVSFPTADGGMIYADQYGQGVKGVVLAHGARLNKESWAPQARTLAEAGYLVLAIDFRGYGQSSGPGQSDPLSAPLALDVLGAVRFLRQAGATTVAVIGGSMGGAAAGAAAIAAEPGEIDRVVLLAAAANGPPEQLKGRKLFIVARGDTTGNGMLRLVRIQEQFDKAPEPKQLIVLDGTVHAQWLFQTDQGPRLMHELLQFLSAP
jgi:pimeloyl-ACP methyl ester carboxylesterase